MAEERNRSRLAFVDVARGLAVVLMLQTHAYDAWLRPELRQSEFFRWSQLIGGLPGAFFLFLMGVSMALGNDASRDRGAVGTAIIKRTLVRAALLLVVAFLFRLALFLASDRPDVNAIFRVDILNCLAASLALLAPLDLLPNRSSRVFLASGVGIWFAMATPFVWDGGLVTGLPERLAGYLTGRVPNTTFPIFPWSAYAFAGHATGSLIGAARHQGLERMMNVLLSAGGAMIPASLMLDRLETIGPKYDYWWTSPNFVLIKIGVLIVLVWLCFRFDRLVPRADRRLQPVSGAMVQMGRTSLFIYCVHVDLVYGSKAFPRLWRSCEIGEASRNLVLLTLGMLALSYGWSWLKTRARVGR
ncbi:MAG: DUF1624 domain-containing protein [Vicinamibacteria bacterium]|nr:DUF1624 domain-containing protein [Vicinamibacteria bacterium]